MIVGIVSEICRLAGVEVTAFTPFRPYKLQRVVITDQHLGQVVNKPWVGVPKKYDPPADRFEYEDWIQDKMIQKWKDLEERERERQELKKDQRAEVLEVVEEIWKAPPLVSLRTIHEADLKKQVDPFEPVIHETNDDTSVLTPEQEQS